jgi:hypothetical protein
MKVGSKSEAMHSASRHGTKLGRGVDYEEAVYRPAPRAKPYPHLTEKQVKALWAKVAKRGPDECWEWTAARQGSYGAFKAAGRSLRASRLIYILTYGEVPLHLDILHSCDNSGCVNPAHLEPGTPRQNLKDCVDRGRKNAARGEAAGKAKLTSEQVYEVRRRYDAGESPLRLAQEFGLSGPGVCAVGLRQVWRHLPEMETTSN